MRKHIILTAVAVIALVTAAVALAAPTYKSTLTVKVKPSKASTAHIARGTSLNVDTKTISSDGSKPPTNTRADIFFNKGFKFNYKPFRKCPKADLEAHHPELCAKAKIGTGHGTIDTGFGGALRIAQATVTAFNEGGGKILLYSVVTSPTLLAGIDTTLEGALKRITTGADAKKFGYKLDVPIALAPPAPGSPPPTITDFQVKVLAHTTVAGKRVDYVTTPTTCVHGKWHFKGIFKLSGGTKNTVNASAPCTR